MMFWSDFQQVFYGCLIDIRRSAIATLQRWLNDYSLRRDSNRDGDRHTEFLMFLSTQVGLRTLLLCSHVTFSQAGQTTLLSSECGALVFTPSCYNRWILPHKLRAMIKISSAFSFFIGDFFSNFVFGIHDCCSWTISRLSSETSKIRFTFFYYYYYVFSLQEIYGCFTPIFSSSNMKFFYLVAVFSVNALRQKPFYATKKKKRFPDLIELFRNLFFLLFLEQPI